MTEAKLVVNVSISLSLLPALHETHDAEKEDGINNNHAVQASEQTSNKVLRVAGELGGTTTDQSCGRGAGACGISDERGSSAVVVPAALVGCLDQLLEGSILVHVDAVEVVLQLEGHEPEIATCHHGEGCTGGNEVGVPLEPRPAWHEESREGEDEDGNDSNAVSHACGKGELFVEEMADGLVTELQSLAGV